MWPVKDGYLSNDPLPSASRLAQFEITAAALLAQHGWRLLTPAEVACRAEALLAATPAPTASVIARACQQVYAHCLYLAVQEPAHQALAYGELHAYLYRIALRQRPAVAEDAAQEAIVLVHQKRHECHTPGAFLKFAIYQLLTAFHRLTPSAHEVSLEETLTEPETEEAQPAWLTAPQDPAAEVAAQMANAQLLRWLRTVIENNPRARNQILAVTLKYLEEWDDETIAATLATTVANVHVLRSRGLIKLREEYQQSFGQVQAL